MIQKEAVQALGRYSDLLFLVSFLPVLVYAKFGYIIREKKAEHLKKQEEKARKNGKSASEDDSQNGKEGDANAGDSFFADYAPPILALVLVLVAEVCTASQFFDPKDFQARRAVGAFGRMRKKNSNAGMNEGLQAVMKLLEDADVYEFLRIIATMACILALLSTVVMQKHGIGMFDPQETIGNPFKYVFRNFVKLAKLVANPNILLALIFLACFIVGHRTALGKFFRRPGGNELLVAFASLARGLAAATVASYSTYSGNLSLWCALQAAAAVSRAAHTYNFQRVPWSSILQADVTGTAELVKGTLIMEALVVLCLLPSILCRKRLFPVFFALCLPSVACLLEGPQQKMLEPLILVPEMVPKLAMVFLAMSVVSLFLSGIPGIFCGGIVVQLLVYVHGLDSIKI